jgi:hypothetical protein
MGLVKSCNVVYSDWATGVLSRVRMLPGESEFSFSKSPDRPSRPPSLLLSVYRDCFPGAKRTGSEFDCLAPSSVEGKNEWSYTSTPHIRPRGVVREKFKPFSNNGLET